MFSRDVLSIDEIQKLLNKNEEEEVMSESGGSESLSEEDHESLCSEISDSICEASHPKEIEEKTKDVGETFFHRTPWVAELKTGEVEIKEEMQAVEKKAEETSLTFFQGRDGTKWSSYPYPESQPNSCNVISDLNKVVLPPGKVIEGPADAFGLYLDDTVLTQIIGFTNLEAKRYIPTWKDIDMIELKAFLGILILAGHLKDSSTGIEMLWDKNYGRPAFRAAMSMSRFKKIVKFLRFDDKTTRSDRRAKDKLAPIRDVFERVNLNFRKHYLPGSNITIDEQIVGFRGKCPFRQFLQHKAQKHGIKIFWACDSQTFYPLGAIPYAGKDGNIKDCCDLAHDIVMSLSEPYFGSGRNITTNNYFTSLSLASGLVQNKLTIVGAMRKKQTCIPTEFFPNKKRRVNTTLFGFTKNATLLSYTAKQYKAVILLSTMHHSVTFDRSTPPKPEALDYYNKTKGGVDSFDELVREYSTKRKTNWWPLAFFFNLVDAAGVASHVIWKEMYPDDVKSSKRYLFLRALGESLVSEQTLRRGEERKRISDLIKTSSALETGIINKTPENNKRKRCHLCPSGKSRKQKQSCDVCGENVCNEHAKKKLICYNC